jgi:hypothetical protein
MKKKLKKFLANLEFKIFIWFLKRYACYDMDQWDLFQVKLPDGHNTAYVYIGLAPDPDGKPEHYRKLDS